MTSEQRQIIQATKHGSSFERLYIDSYMDFFEGCKVGPLADAAARLDRTYNKPDLYIAPKATRQTVYPVGNPVSCFEIQHDDVKPAIFAMTRLAFAYGHDRVGYIDVNDAVDSGERNRGTVADICRLGRVASGNSGIMLIAVEAGYDLEELQAQRGGEIYTALDNLPSSNYRVAILGQSSSATEVAQV